MEGRTWSLSEVPEFGGNMTSDCPIQSNRWPDPPAVIRQHASCQRSFVALSAQVSFGVFQSFIFPSCPCCPGCPNCPSCPHCPVVVVLLVVPVVQVVLVVIIYQLHFSHHPIFMTAISTGKLPFYNLSASWAASSVIIAESGIWFWCSSSFLQASQGKKDAREGNDVLFVDYFFVLICGTWWCNMKIWFIKGNVKMVNMDLLSRHWTGRPGMCNMSCFGLWCNSNPTTSELK